MQTTTFSLNRLSGPALFVAFVLFAPASFAQFRGAWPVAPIQQNNVNPSPTAANWTSNDIGAVGAAGNTTGTSSSLTLSGSGADIWGTQDAFRFHHVPLAGDQQMIVRVASIDKSDDWAKAGVMFRENLDPDARNVMLYATPANVVGMQWRTAKGGEMQFLPGGSITLPVWLKLVRQGNTFVGYQSQDGTNWTLVSPVTLDLPPNAEAGFAVTSHAAGQLCRATFDQVHFERPTPSAAPPAPIALVATPAAEGKVNLAWKDNSSNESAFSIERSTDNLTFSPIATVAANATNYTDQTEPGSTAYYYRIRAIAANTPSTYSNVANAATGPATATWTANDVGTLAQAGSETIAPNAVTIRGGGNDIWESADAFHFVHRPLRGDGSLVAKLSSLENTNDWAKAGLMIRESLEPGARNVFLNVTPSHGAGLQWRADANKSTTVNMSGDVRPPVWLKLTRSGDTVTAFTSTDGNQWNQVGSQTLSLGSNALIGFAITAHDPAALSSATFTDIQAQ